MFSQEEVRATCKWYSDQLGRRSEYMRLKSISMFWHGVVSGLLIAGLFLLLIIMWG